MIDYIGGLLMEVLRVYAWTVGLGLALLVLVVLVESAVDLIRDLRPRTSTRRLSRHHT